MKEIGVLVFVGIVVLGILAQDLWAQGVKQDEPQFPLFGIMSEMDDPYYVYPKNKKQMMDDAKDRGIDFWQTFIWWSEYEPERGKYNQEYVIKTKKKLNDLLNKGFKIEITITFGDSPPDWVWQIPNIYYKNQYGEEFKEGKFRNYKNYPQPTMNIIFNPELRKAQSEFIKRFFTDFSEFKDKIYAVYTNITGEGDSVYPFVIDDDSNSWWAYDKNAQNQKNPGSLAGPNPVPGWRPGDESPNGEAEKFYNWYIESAYKTVEWQVREFRKYYNGKIKLMSDIYWNNENVTNDDIEEAINSNLGGTIPEPWRLPAGFSTIYAENLSVYPNLIPHHSAIELMEDAEVNFIKKYFPNSPLSAETSDWWINYPAGEYDGKRVLDTCFEKIKKYKISEFKWVRDRELYEYRNPSPEYYEKKINDLKGNLKKEFSENNSYIKKQNNSGYFWN
jgi:hypothetical protein